MTPNDGPQIKALTDVPVSTAYYFDHLATPEDIAVMVSEDDFVEAQNELVASVTSILSALSQDLVLQSERNTI